MSAAISTFRQVFAVGIQNTFVYRWNFLLRMFFGIVPLVGMIFLWKAVTASSGGQLASYAYHDVIFYFMMVVFLENLISATEDDFQIAGDIRDGRLSALLLKPVNYLLYRFALYASYRLTYIAVIALPLVVLGFVLREYIKAPTDLVTWGAFALSVVMAAVMQFLLACCLGYMAFWVLEVSTLIFIVFSFEYFLSGTMFPLDLFPPWLQPFIKWSPFTYEMYFPVQIAMQRVKGAAMWEGLAIQAGWVVGFYVLASLLWRAGVRKYQAVGG